MPDNAQNTFTNVGPNGEITYEFEGLIKALGLNLPAANVTSPPNVNKVRWLNELEEAVAYITGIDQPNVRQIISRVSTQAGGHEGYNRMEVFDGFSSKTSTIQAFVNGAANIAEASASAGGRVVILVDSNSASSFLQNPSKANRVQNRGEVEIEFPGTGTKKLSNIVTVSHGLGAVPAGIQLTAIRSEAGEVLFEPVVIQGSLTSTVFKVRIISVGEVAAGIKVPVYWQATT